MELYKRAKTKNYFEIFIFILLCLSVLYLIFQILISTGFAIDGGVISDNKGEQTAKVNFVIELRNAEHYGEDYVNNIYNELRELDEIWSEEIYDGDYVRVVFEEKLDSRKDITIYPRIISGEPRIEVYEKDRSEIIARFDNLIGDKYN